MVDKCQGETTSPWQVGENHPPANVLLPPLLREQSRLLVKLLVPKLPFPWLFNIPEARQAKLSQTFMTIGTQAELTTGPASRPLRVMVSN